MLLIFSRVSAMGIKAYQVLKKRRTPAGKAVSLAKETEELFDMAATIRKPQS